MTPSQTPSAPHSFAFFRSGGFAQVRLRSGADLMALDQLDQKLWVALSCPTSGLEIDAATLAYIDTDKDSRIRAPEVIAAVKWAGGCLKNPDDLLRGAEELPIAAINDATDEGRTLAASARRILKNLEKEGATGISAADTGELHKIFALTQFNGDGIIPAEAAEDPTIAQVITDILACQGQKTDRSGKPGVDQAAVDAFFTEAEAFAGWWQKAESDPAVLPLGPATAGAASALKAVRAKVDDYFARCRLAAFDSRAIAALNREESEYLALAAKDLTITSDEISALPLARIDAGRPLPLVDGLNPAWATVMEAFREQVVKPLLGDKKTLSEADFAVLVGKLQPFEAWSTGKAGAGVEKLGLERVKAVLGSGARAAITELIQRDLALEAESNAIASVDKLVHYHRDLIKLLHNFVSFRDFYSSKEKAIFQAGTLYLDQRSCELCMRVEDAARHGTLAMLSRTYLVYCDCVRRATNEKMSIVAAVTSGDSDNLMVGRNGVFYDRKGRDWDATITKLVDNPISVRQAFWSPYKRTMRWIEEQVAKRAAAADTASTDRLTKSAEETASVAQTGKAPPAKPKFDVGVVAALGVAVGGITAALGALLQAFFGLGFWMPLGLLSLLLAISGPSMIIAWLKLRQRNIGPLLDANGWAINAKALINIPFGGSLTGTARLPRGSQLDLTDPFKQKSRGKLITLIAIIVLALAGLWYLGKLDSLLPRSLESTTILKTKAEDRLKLPGQEPPPDPAKAPEPPPAPAKP